RLRRGRWLRRGRLGPPAPPPTGTLPIERGETAGDLVAGVTGQSEPTGGPKPDQPTAETDIGDFSKLVELVRSAPQAATESTRAEPLDRRLSIVVSQTEELPGAAAPGPEPAPAGGLSIDQTAYWNPAIVTGQDGRATVTITLPPQSTAWTLVAKGITADTLAGEATEQLVVRQEFFAQLKLPQAFTEGDQAEVIALVHNEAVEAGQIQVTLRTTIGMRSVEQTKTIEVQAPGEHEVAFTVDLSSPDTQPAESKGRPEEVQFELTVQAGDHQHTVHRAVPLLPYGAPVYATSGGTASGDTTTWVEMPAGLPVRGPRLTTFVAPTVERSLLDVVLAPRRIALGGCLLWELYSEIESAGSDLMAALGLEQLVGATPAAGGPVVVALDRRIRSAIARLIASQNQRGGWSWTGRGAATDGPTTARLVWALSLARSAGYPVPEKNYQQAISWIKKQMARTADTDRRSKAILLHALATAGEGDFSVANRLHRERTQLGPKAALYLALAFAAMDREATARELLERVRAPAQADSATRAADDWDAETWALYALALQQLTPQAPQTKSSVQWLLAHRVGPRWEPDRATGPATLALCRWFAGRRVETQRYQIAVFVNDVQAAVLQIDGRSGTQEIAVPARLLHEGRQRINFQLTGRGRYTYQCLLGGFVPAEQLKTTIAGCQVRRTYQPAPLEVDGKEIPRGFRIATGRYTRFQNRLTQLPVGRRAIVRLSVRCPDNEGGPASPFDYLVVTEPIPAGTAVVESSITGSFERYEISPGAITFFLGRARPETTIQYEVHGYLPGKYRARPAIVRNAHRPDQMAVGPAKTLTVLPAGATSSDPYQLTPQELYALGTHYFRQGELQTAEKHLSELVSRWSLTPPVYKKAVRMLLDIQLQEGSPPEVVRYFEIVKERWPEEEISFDKSLRIAAAYHEIGEYERSYLAYRATVEGRFVRESSLAGFLEDHGRFLQGVHFIQDLLRQYPPEPYVAAATYALAQRIYAKAPEAARDPELRRAKVTRVDLIRRASDMLEDFLTEYPEDPAADQAAFARANTLLELKAYREAAEACRQYADRYPASDLLDTFWYIIGYCQFAMGQHDAALEMCQKVAQASVVDKKTGRKREAKNKWQAIYILGQIYHSLGRAAEAIQQYRLVEDRFADAKKSIEYFLRKQIALPEVTTVRPGQPVRVELTFRNLAACDVRVYRIDLMKFSLLRRDLGAITRINLAGIRPEHQVTVSLGDGVDYRDRTHSLPLPLEEEGAYLIVARGDNLHASGLVLISPLVVEVQYDRKAGQVRATVKDVVANRYVRDVEVKVIGTGNVDFVSGSTDLRGVFVAEGIRGLPTVVARSGASRYAFYRSPGIMPGLPPPPLPAVAQATPRPPTAQAPIQPVPAPGSSRSAVQRRMENQRRIQAALDSPTAFQFQDTPLDDAIDYLQRLHRIEIRLDRRALEAVGLSEDTPITQTASGITLRSALDLILDQLDLDFVIHNEVLLITTPEQLETEEFQTTVVYPVTDLVRFRDEEGKTWSDFQSLIDAIQTTVQPDTWDVVGGPGSIAPMTFGDTDVLVFSQTQKVHEQVAEFLANLRRIAGTSERKEGELPVKERPKPGAESPFGWGGMGGFGGAMGGFGGAMGGGGRGAFGGDPFGISVAPVEGQAPEAGPPPAAGPPDLLKGIQDANRQMQSQQTEQLQKMYQKGSGMGGMGAGGLF
ncbi:MAG TPA: tetratricopeptide repeat protein, partial [Planctomycetes bacterium]|nr:tetratricopeptide repeat protein [Planctomycetota bacterium]